MAMQPEHLEINTDLERQVEKLLLDILEKQNQEMPLSIQSLIQKSVPGMLRRLSREVDVLFDRILVDYESPRPLWTREECLALGRLFRGYGDRRKEATRKIMRTVILRFLVAILVTVTLLGVPAHSPFGNSTGGNARPHKHDSDNTTSLKSSDTS